MAAVNSEVGPPDDSLRFKTRSCTIKRSNSVNLCVLFRILPFISTEFDSNSFVLDLIESMLAKKGSKEWRVLVVDYHSMRVLSSGTFAFPLRPL